MALLRIALLKRGRLALDQGKLPLFLGLAFRKLYPVPQACTAGTSCADPQATKRQRLIFWSVAVLLLGLLAVPWFAPLFY